MEDFCGFDEFIYDLPHLVGVAAIDDLQKLATAVCLYSVFGRSRIAAITDPIVHRLTEKVVVHDKATRKPFKLLVGDGLLLAKFNLLQQIPFGYHKIAPLIVQFLHKLLDGSTLFWIVGHLQHFLGLFHKRFSRTGIPKVTLSYYMSGKTEPKADRIYTLAKELNVSEAWLMGFDVPMPRPDEQKKNDVLAEVIVRLRSDEKLYNLVVMLADADEAKLDLIDKLVSGLK